MIFGAFIGVLFVRTMQGSEVFTAAAAAGDYATLKVWNSWPWSWQH